MNDLRSTGAGRSELDRSGSGSRSCASELDGGRSVDRSRLGGYLVRSVSDRLEDRDGSRSGSRGSGLFLLGLFGDSIDLDELRLGLFRSRSRNRSEPKRSRLFFNGFRNRRSNLNGIGEVNFLRLFLLGCRNRRVLRSSRVISGVVHDGLLLRIFRIRVGSNRNVVASGRGVVGGSTIGTSLERS